MFTVVRRARVIVSTCQVFAGEHMPVLKPEAPVTEDESDVTSDDTAIMRTKHEERLEAASTKDKLQPQLRPQHLPIDLLAQDHLTSFQSRMKDALSSRPTPTTSHPHTRTCPATLQSSSSARDVTLAHAPTKKRSLSSSEIQNWKRILARKATKYDLQLIEHNHRRLPIMRIRMRHDVIASAAHDTTDAELALGRSKRLHRSGSGGSDSSTGDASRTPEKDCDVTDHGSESSGCSSLASDRTDDDVSVDPGARTRIKIRLRLGRELAVVRDVQKATGAP